MKGCGTKGRGGVSNRLQLFGMVLRGFPNANAATVVRLSHQTVIEVEVMREWLKLVGCLSAFKQKDFGNGEEL